MFAGQLYRHLIEQLSVYDMEVVPVVFDHTVIIALELTVLHYEEGSVKMTVEQMPAVQ